MKSALAFSSQRCLYSFSHSLQSSSKPISQIQRLGFLRFLKAFDAPAWADIYNTYSLYYLMFHVLLKYPLLSSPNEPILASKQLRFLMHRFLFLSCARACKYLGAREKRHFNNILQYSLCVRCGVAWCGEERVCVYEGRNR